MKSPVAGSLIGLAVGAALVAAFCIPILVVGRRVALSVIGDLFAAAPDIPGGQLTGWLLLGFIVALPVAGIAIALFSVFNLRRHR